MKLVNFDCPEELLKEFDHFIKRKGWQIRAEALREAMRRFMKEA